MNNFSKRLIFGIIYVLLIVFATITSAIAFYGLFFVFMMLSIYEFQKMIKLESCVSYIFGISLFMASYLRHLDYSVIGNVVMILGMLVVFISFINTLLDEKKKAISHLGKITLTILYTVVPFILLISIPDIFKTFNSIIVLGIFILTWTSDTFAYLIGRQLGKNKLFERISPKKTVEGFIGGVIFTFIAAYVISFYFTNTSLLQWLIISIIISIFGVVGDLIESMFKRQANIKDSSNLIPGHGGFLDRLDSIIYATPFIFTFIYLTKNLNLH